MNSYLQGRKTVARRGGVGIDVSVAGATAEDAADPELNIAAIEEKTDVVSADAPRVEVVSVNGRVERIQITCKSGEYIELHCRY